MDILQKLPAGNKVTYSWMCFLRLSRNWFLFKSGLQTWLAKNPETLPSTLWWRFWYAGWKHIRDDMKIIATITACLLGC